MWINLWALRVAGYYGTEYRAQIIDLDEGTILNPYPVITLVLYFGYKKHWDQPKSLFETLSIPEEFRTFVNDLKINLFEIAYLTREQVNLFQSDFKIVADYFVQMRESGKYVPIEDVPDHIKAVLQLLNVMEKDNRFEEKVNESIEKEEIRTMSEWLTKIINESEANGVARGISQGLSQGENRLGKLVDLLLNQGRTEDLKKAAKNPEYRNRLYQELQII